jgi:radical SAM protein with 4Fe4S-binding SPASM domain
MKKFRKTYIEITNVCDSACEFCPGTSRPPQFMSRDLFSAILSQLDGFAKLLHFHVMGEPLLHPEIGTFLDLCVPFGYEVNLITNGKQLAKTADAVLGKPALRQVSISVHSLSPASSGSERDAYFRDIVSFVTKARSAPPLSISLRLWNRGVGTEPRLQTDIFQRIESAFALPYCLQAHLSQNDSAKLADSVWLNCADRFVWPDLKGEDFGEHGFCLGLRDQIAILADGNVVPCCLDREGIVDLGNIQKSGLREILSSERALKMRNGFARKVVAEELCRKCSYRLRFDDHDRNTPI